MASDEWGLDGWIGHLDKSIGEGELELDDLDKVELLNLLIELQHKRQDETLMSEFDKSCDGCGFRMKCNDCDRDNSEWKKCFLAWLKRRFGVDFD
jgi:hypothetical protein